VKGMGWCQLEGIIRRVRKINWGRLNDRPGRMAFRLGLTSEPLGAFLGILAREGEGSPVDFACFAAPLPFGSDLSGITCLEGGARLLLMPSRPRFIILAGVTGVICVLKFGEGGGSVLLVS